MMRRSGEKTISMLTNEIMHILDPELLIRSYRKKLNMSMPCGAVRDQSSCIGFIMNNINECRRRKKGERQGERILRILD